MQRTALAASLAILSLALAGCSEGGDGGGDATGDDPGGDAAPAASSQEFSFTLGPAVGLPVGGGLLPVGDDDRIPFEVPAGQGLLEAQVEWTCAAGALCELELELRHGESDLVTSDFGASPVTLVVDGPQAGRWTFWAFPSGGGSAVVGLEGTLTIELS